MDTFDLQCDNKRLNGCVDLYRARDRYFSRILAAKINRYWKSRGYREAVGSICESTPVAFATIFLGLDLRGYGSWHDRFCADNVSTAGTELLLPITLTRHGVRKTE